MSNFMRARGFGAVACVIAGSLLSTGCDESDVGAAAWLTAWQRSS
jgi:hypothetical protein